MEKKKKKKKKKKNKKKAMKEKKEKKEKKTNDRKKRNFDRSKFLKSLEMKACWTRYRVQPRNIGKS